MGAKISGTNKQNKNPKNNLNMKPANRLIIGGLIILAGFIFGILTIIWMKNLLGLGIFGISVFFVILIGSDILSGTIKFNTGEVRKAITVSFLSVYLMLPGIFESLGKESPLLWVLNSTTITSTASTTATTSTILNGFLSNFWIVITVIIGFYFASRTAEKVAKITQGSQPPENQPPENQPPENQPPENQP